MSSGAVHFRLDGSSEDLAGAAIGRPPKVDVGAEGEALRFITSERAIERFAARHQADFRPFTLGGSGDFHHLTAVWLRQFQEPFLLLSFDNHPDWDIRPPYWSCGAWINRALENQRVREIAVWGCDSFECRWPGRLLGNRAAARAHRLRVHPWRSPGHTYPDWLAPTTPETWRSTFLTWLQHHAGEAVYLTIDLDVLDPADAVTNWEAGRLRLPDLFWAIGEVRQRLRLIGGDLVGFWSPPRYATRLQKMGGWCDHPRLPTIAKAERRAVNQLAYERLWPALTGANLTD